jgi:predicted AAA+ superfamily ATPase
MKRYLWDATHEFLGRKFLLITGPRQVGKTTLAKSLTKDFAYYNYDIKKDMRIFKDQNWDREKSLIVFDELHKMKKWKLWLKGIYDEGLTQQQQFVVTGSARLDIAKKMGDSLAGRFFSLRLHPLDIKELASSGEDPQKAYKKLLQYGGFPEPYFTGTERFYRQWQRSHADLILRQDLIYFESVRDIEGIEVLIELLSQRVGSVISYSSLAKDIQRDEKTIKKWLQILENLYIVFRVPVYAKNIARSKLKAGKYYFYDLGKVQGDLSCRVENLVALALKKEIDYQLDYQGIMGNLYFLQNLDKKEIDFFVEQKGSSPWLIEVKMGDHQESKNFSIFESYFKSCKKIQLVADLDHGFTTKNGVQIRNLANYLAKLDLSDQ